MRFINNSVKGKWRYLGAITAAQAELTVTGRDCVTADALGATKVKVLTTTGGDMPYGFLLRFRTGGTEDQTNVLQVYASTGDHYHKIGQLTITQGQQIHSTGIYFSDTITPASEDALFDGEESNLANQIAHYYFRAFGFIKFLFLASTLNSTTVYIEYKEMYE